MIRNCSCENSLAEKLAAIPWFVWITLFVSVVAVTVIIFLIVIKTSKSVQDCIVKRMTGKEISKAQDNVDHIIHSYHQNMIFTRAASKKSKEPKEQP